VTPQPIVREAPPAPSRSEHGAVGLPQTFTLPAWYVTGVQLWREARANWRLVLTLALAGAAGGTAAALLLPSRYEARAAFQAENPPSQLALGGVGIGGLLGSQLGGLGIGGSQSTPQLLADLLTTDAVLRRVVNATYPWDGQSMTLAAIYGFDKKPAVLRDFLAIRKLRHGLSTDLDIRTGVVRFRVEGWTPELALAMAETTLAVLNEANIALRKQRASAERTFTAQRSGDARLALAVAESTLAAFYQRNRNLTTSPTLQMEEASLRRSVDIAQQLFVQLRLQEEQAALQELRNTPSIGLIDPPVLPARRSWPKRQLTVALGLLIGLAVAFVRLSWPRMVP
jgi:uncharacterized protein involved in exopolysaccharide biosynthesis